MLVADILCCKQSVPAGPRGGVRVYYQDPISAMKRRGAYGILIICMSLTRPFATKCKMGRGGEGRKGTTLGF